MPSVVPDGGTTEPHESVESPGKVMRIGSMIKQLLEEVRQTELDEPSRERLREIYDTSIAELSSSLSPDLQEELARLALPFEPDTAPTGPELRIAKAQLVGLARGPLPRHPGHALRPADGGPAAARADAGPARPGRPDPAARRPRPTEERSPPGTYL